MPAQHSPLSSTSSRSAATCMHSQGEVGGGPEDRRQHGDADGACCRQLGGLAAASLAERIQEE
eukprot:781826-Prymnesium_polylepis.1